MRLHTSYLLLSSTHLGRNLSERSNIQILLLRGNERPTGCIVQIKDKVFDGVGERTVVVSHDCAVINKVGGSSEVVRLEGSGWWRGGTGWSSTMVTDELLFCSYVCSLSIFCMLWLWFVAFVHVGINII